MLLHILQGLQPEGLVQLKAMTKEKAFSSISPSLFRPVTRTETRLRLEAFTTRFFFRSDAVFYVLAPINEKRLEKVSFIPCIVKGAKLYCKFAHLLRNSIHAATLQTSITKYYR